MRFAERIRIAGKLVEENALVALLEECERANDGKPMTFFEMTTAAAFVAFARTPAEIALIEVGLGGRFDATNIFPHPAVTAITPVSIDHQQFLGDTVAQIAFEKAGILKPGVPGVIARQVPEAMAVIDARAKEIGAPLYRQGIEWDVHRREDGGLSYRGTIDLDLPAPGLLGAHQYGNAGTALACLDRLWGEGFAPAALGQGLREVEWPARLQRLDRGALAQMMPAGAELWLDGGHNAGGGAVLGEVARTWHDKPLHLVFGMLKTHDARAFLAGLAPYAARLEAIAIPGEENSSTAAETAEAARDTGLSATPQPSITAAVTAAATPGARVLICGSLYLAGRVLAENDRRP